MFNTIKKLVNKQLVSLTRINVNRRALFIKYLIKIIHKKVYHFFNYNMVIFIHFERVVYENIFVILLLLYITYIIILYIILIVFTCVRIIFNNSLLI